MAQSQQHTLLTPSTAEKIDSTDHQELPNAMTRIPSAQNGAEAAVSDGTLQHLELPPHKRAKLLIKDLQPLAEAGNVEAQRELERQRAVNRKSNAAWKKRRLAQAPGLIARIMEIDATAGSDAATVDELHEERNIMLASLISTDKSCNLRKMLLQNADADASTRAIINEATAWRRERPERRRRASQIVSLHLPTPSTSTTSETGLDKDEVDGTPLAMEGGSGKTVIDLVSDEDKDASVPLKAPLSKSEGSSVSRADNIVSTKQVAAKQMDNIVSNDDSLEDLEDRDLELELREVRLERKRLQKWKARKQQALQIKKEGE